MTPSAASGPSLTYGTCVALGAGAALLLGPPGSGKSDLALRFIMLTPDSTGEKTALVADDQVRLQAVGKRIVARPPGTIAGKIEVRGVGIVDVPFRAEAVLKLAIHLASAYDVPRLPSVPPAMMEFVGLQVPVLTLTPFEASAPLKLKLALQCIAR
ncbi:MAG: hypothetical protein P8Y67_05365 [Alphaproteobacteria bacterium]